MFCILPNFFLPFLILFIFLIDDPDLLSSEAISVIRGVLQEELGASLKENLPGTGEHLSKELSPFSE